MQPDISKLLAVLISIAIGVVQYAFNNVTGIFGIIARLNNEV